MGNCLEKNEDDTKVFLTNKQFIKNMIENYSLI